MKNFALISPRRLRRAGLGFSEGALLGLDRMAMTREDKEAFFYQSRAEGIDTESIFVARAAWRAALHRAARHFRSGGDQLAAGRRGRARPGWATGHKAGVAVAVEESVAAARADPGRDRGQRALNALAAARDAAAALFSAPLRPGAQPIFIGSKPYGVRRESDVDGFLDHIQETRPNGRDHDNGDAGIMKLRIPLLPFSIIVQA